MSDFTPRANLRLPGGGSTGTILPDEQVDIDVLNNNFRKIDALLGARNIPSASSYAGSMDGDLVYARDTEFLHMFSANAGGLITPRLPGARQYSGTAAERVAFAPQAKGGDLWRDTDNIGVIWVYKAGSPGTWEYTGNPLRGTRAAMDQLVTDGRAVEGMTVFNTTDSSDYVKIGAGWVWARGSKVYSRTTGSQTATAATLITGFDQTLTLAAAQDIRFDLNFQTSNPGGAGAGVFIALRTGDPVSGPLVRGWTIPANRPGTSNQAVAHTLSTVVSAPAGTTRYVVDFSAIDVAGCVISAHTTVPAQMAITPA